MGNGNLDPTWDDPVIRTLIIAAVAISTTTSKVALAREIDLFGIEAKRIIEWNVNRWHLANIFAFWFYIELKSTVAFSSKFHFTIAIKWYKPIWDERILANWMLWLECRYLYRNRSKFKQTPTKLPTHQPTKLTANDTQKKPFPFQMQNPSQIRWYHWNCIFHQGNRIKGQSHLISFSKIDTWNY